MGTKVLIFPDKCAFDTADGSLTALGAVWEQGETSVSVQPCDTEGNTYTVQDAGETEPEEPEDGQLFLKGSSDDPYGYSAVLEKYSAKSKKWGQLIMNTVRISCPGIGTLMKEGDTVTVSGVPQSVCDALAGDLNGETVVQALDGDSIIASLTPAQDSTRYYGEWMIAPGGITWRSLDGRVTETEAARPQLKLERRVPDLDFVTENDNRVWGCSRSENTIYACKLGDPTNWFSYRGIAADSYAVNVGSDGAFTGAASCLGYVLFFKENCIHKLYGSKPSDYQLTSVRCRGVAKNAARSLCVLNETLYYLSPDGVMAWDGSLPAKVSASLDTGGLDAVEWTASGSLDARYYLYLRQTGASAGRLLVYDAERGLWQEESPMGEEMTGTGRQLYLWDGSALWAADPGREADSGSTDGLETGMRFEAVTGDIGLGTPDDKYISRVTLRLDALEENSMVTLAVSWNGGAWETVNTCRLEGEHNRVNLPFEPHRHDTLRLRISGKGQVALRSVAYTLAGTSGNRVSGGIPRK